MPIRDDRESDEPAGTMQVVAAQRIAGLLILGFGLCEEGDIALNERQRISLLTAAMLEFDGVRAEIRGLLNQAIRRLERLEGDLLAERHARIDDLALLVDLVSSGWKGVDARLEKVERATVGGTVHPLRDAG